MKMDAPEAVLQGCIEQMRKKMVDTAQYNGLHSIETLQCSQKLDALINIHMKYCATSNIETLKNVS
jgi:hypothetical protein